jgi:hypothetical protein
MLTQKLPLEFKYIYVPLHFQPEMSTTPLAGVFTDQIPVIQLLSSVMPDDIKIVVKEHPAQKSDARSYNFYKIISTLPNVIFVNDDEDTHSLIRNSIAVATCTGTAGWEALFKLKPILVFGSFVYEIAPGAYKISSKEDCVKAINSILHQENSFTLADIVMFLYAIELSTLEGKLMSGVDGSCSIDINSFDPLLKSFFKQDPC